jgi:hypothetical protein
MSRMSADEGQVYAGGGHAMSTVSAHADGMCDRPTHETAEEGDRVAGWRVRAAGGRGATG